MYIYVYIYVNRYVYVSLKKILVRVLISGMGLARCHYTLRLWHLMTEACHTRMNLCVGR